MSYPNNHYPSRSDSDLNPRPTFLQQPPMNYRPNLTSMPPPVPPPPVSRFNSPAPFASNTLLRPPPFSELNVQFPDLRTPPPSFMRAQPRMNRAQSHANFSPIFPGRMSSPANSSQFSKGYAKSIPHKHLQTDPNTFTQEVGAKKSESKNWNIPENDEENWFKNWICKIQSRHQNEGDITKPKLKLANVQEKLLEYGTAIFELGEIGQKMESKNCSKESLTDLKKLSQISIEKINRCTEYFSRNEWQVSALVKERREKRIRARKNRKIAKKANASLKKRLQEENDRINLIMEQERKKFKDKIHMEKVKKEADLVLKEVRMKQEEANTMKELLTLLIALRTLRSKKGDTHGYVPNEDADSFVVKLKGQFDRLYESQMTHYKAEEETLKVMMEESRSNIPQSSSKSCPTSLLKEKKRIIYQALFGEQMVAKDSFLKSFTSADDSLEVLLNTRRDWDAMLDASGTPIPINWVLPPNFKQEPKEWIKDWMDGNVTNKLNQ